MKRGVAALHSFVVFAFSATDAAGKFVVVRGEVTAAFRPDDRNASHGDCDERRDTIVVDIATALMVLLYIIHKIIFMICVSGCCVEVIVVRHEDRDSSK
jgi:hypothetical protein